MYTHMDVYTHATYIYIYIYTYTHQNHKSQESRPSTTGQRCTSLCPPGGSHSEKGEVLLRGVGTLQYFSPPDASVQWQPDDLAIPTNMWLLGAGSLGAPPVSLSQREEIADHYVTHCIHHADRADADLQTLGQTSRRVHTGKPMDKDVPMYTCVHHSSLGPEILDKQKTYIRVVYRHNEIQNDRKIDDVAVQGFASRDQIVS